MPLDLTEDEPMTAAMACRARIKTAKRAKGVENPDMRRHVNRNASRLSDLAEKFEPVRTSARPAGRYTL